MLKIKDNVNLEELEKFGFEKNYFIRSCIFKYKEKIVIWANDRKILIKEMTLPNVLYDLIKADLVEKVEED